MRWGEQTTDEMALVFLNVVLPTPADARDFRREVGREYVDQFLAQVETLHDLPYEMLSPDAVQRLTQLFKLFDKNGDGRLDNDERTAMLTFVKNLEQRRQQQ